jgi:hypothetical protein
MSILFQSSKQSPNQPVKSNRSKPDWRGLLTAVLFNLTLVSSA